MKRNNHSQRIQGLTSFIGGEASFFLIFALFSLIVAAYIIETVSQLSFLDIGRSDFTAYYVAGLILRHHGGSQLYNLMLQAKIHAHVIAPNAEGNLPFVYPPIAALFLVPFTYLSLSQGFYVWDFIQLLFMIGACSLVVFSKPLVLKDSNLEKLCLFAIALGTFGMFKMFLLGQIDAICVFGIAWSYVLFMRNRMFLGSFIVSTAIMTTKPQLFVGILFFFIVWRQRYVLYGLLSSFAVLVVTTVLIAHVSGGEQFIRILDISTTLWPLNTFTGMSGLFGGVFGNTFVAYLLTYISFALGIILVGWVGDLCRKGKLQLEYALALAIIIGLLISPHTSLQDFTLLIPPFLWCYLAPSTVMPVLPRKNIVLFWLALSLASVWSILSLEYTYPPLGLPPLVLIIGTCIFLWKYGMPSLREGSA